MTLFDEYETLVNALIYEPGAVRPLGLPIPNSGYLENINGLSNRDEQALQVAVLQYANPPPTVDWPKLKREERIPWMEKAVRAKYPKSEDTNPPVDEGHETNSIEKANPALTPSVSVVAAPEKRMSSKWSKNRRVHEWLAIFKLLDQEMSEATFLRRRKSEKPPRFRVNPDSIRSNISLCIEDLPQDYSDDLKP